MDALLAGLRTVHFAAALSLFGIASFEVFVLKPAPREIDRSLACAAWISLGSWLLSLLAWLLVEAAGMSSQTMTESLRHGTVVTVLTQTQFGHNAELRLVFAALAAACLLRPVLRPNLLLLIFSAALLASLAWVGHAGAMAGWPAGIHLTADGAHLLAAGAWLGGLVPLALFYRRCTGAAWLPAAQRATRRFSTLGLVCVGTIVVSGIANACFTVGTMALLVASDYGRLVLAKIALLAVMVAIAAVNRMILMPRLCAPPPGLRHDAAAPTIGRLQRNALIEAGVGILVLIVVGLLGITSPGHALHH
jgi:copper resistance protein D